MHAGGHRFDSDILHKERRGVRRKWEVGKKRLKKEEIEVAQKGLRYKREIGGLLDGRRIGKG